MERIAWERLASVLICVAFGAVAVVLGVRYLLPILLPFLVAWGLSLLIRPAARSLSRRLGVSQKVCAVILFVLALCSAILVIGVSVHRLVFELQRLLARLLADSDGGAGLAEGSIDFFEMMTSKISFFQHIQAAQRLSAFRERFNDTVSQMLSNVVTSLSESLPAFLGKVASALPAGLLITAVTVIAGFYFCIDGETIMDALCACLPSSIRCRLPVWKTRLRALSWRYLRAYLLLLLVTFSELFLGFCILRIEYAFLLALLIAFVDLLPVLGVGTVLVPWAMVKLLQHDYYLGFGLLILYLAVLILRQILEPRLVGRSLGISPILTLFSAYAGWRLFGFVGMLLGPPLALLGKNLMAQVGKRR